MNARDIYQSRLVDADTAVSHIGSDNDVIVAMCASEPQACMGRFHTVAGRVENVRVFSCLTLKPYDFYMRPEMKGHFELASWFHAPGSRESLKKGMGLVTYVPNMLHTRRPRPQHRAPAGHLLRHLHPARQARLRLPLPGHHLREGHHRGRPPRGAGGQPAAPADPGDTQVHVAQVDFFVENDQEVPTLPSPDPSPTDHAIGGYIADLVADGSTIQLGIGGIPNAAALALRGKKDLGVHTEMMVDSMMELYELGVITNRRKALRPGKFIATFAMGSRRLYDWLDDNVAVDFAARGLGQRPGGDPPEFADGLHQHLHLRGPHRAGGQRVHRPQPVLRHRRPVRHRPGRGGRPRRPGQEHHRLLQHRQGRHRVHHRARRCPRAPPSPCTAPTWTTWSPSTEWRACAAGPCGNGPGRSSASPIRTSARN